MHDGPIIQQGIEARDRLDATFGYHLDGIFTEIERLEARHPRSLVHPPGRRTDTPVPTARVAAADGHYETPPKPADGRRQRAATNKEKPVG